MISNKFNILHECKFMSEKRPQIGSATSNSRFLTSAKSEQQKKNSSKKYEYELSNTFVVGNNLRYFRGFPLAAPFPLLKLSVESKPFAVALSSLVFCIEENSNPGETQEKAEARLCSPPNAEN